MTIEKKAKNESWLLTFTDMLMLLVVMFVLFLSFSEVDSESFRRNAGPIAEAFNQPPPTSLLDGNSAIIPLASTNIESNEPGTSTADATLKKSERSTEQEEDQPQTAVEDNTSKEKPRSNYIREVKSVKLARHLTGVMKTDIQDKKVSLIIENDAVTLRFPSKSTFSSGKAELQEQIKPTIDRIAKIISQTTENDKITVSGHTDSIPISTSRFRSNWELSASRAVSVVHQILEKSGIEKKRVRAVGHADSNPVALNDTEINRALNRRVEIHIEMTDKM